MMQMQTPSPTPELILDALARTLATSRFATSESLRSLLRYAVTKTLAGLGPELKEYSIAVEALGRPPSFDPREDNIVRVQARKLRQRLADYYDSEGRHERCRIVFQPGSYAPSFHFVDRSAVPTRTIAVLPFMNLTADDEAGYFCDGLAEELIDLLSRTIRLRVVARTSSFQFKGVPLDAREIGKRLGADLLIEGAVRGGRPRYVTTVRLLSTSDGCQIWGERYDRTLTDIVALETEIADSVASVLSSGPSPPTSAMEADAITLYLHARQAWNQRTEPGFRRALELYTAAARRDCRAAKAWTGIAECHVLMNMHGLALPRICMPQAREAALRALEIDPGLASAHSAVAAVEALYDRRYDDACGRWQQALAIDPDYATAHDWFSIFGLLPMGRTDEAVKEIEEAQRLDPLSAPIANDVGFVLYWTRHFAEAREQCQRSVQLNRRFYRAHLLDARVLAAEGRYSEAVQTCQLAEETGVTSFRPYLLGTLGYAYAALGDEAAARDITQQLVKLEECCVTAHERALIHAGLGEWQESTAALQAAVEQCTGWAGWLKFDPLFDGLRARELPVVPAFT
jgi:adenylate cyclase